MSHAINYQPARYGRIGQGELYVDHRQKKSAWKNLKTRVRRGVELVNAKLKTIFDARLRASYHTNLVRQYLRGVGLSGLDLLKPETFYIAKLLHKNEVILGAIVGKLEEGGSALIVVTDLRVIYLNQIPLFTKMDEVGYGIVTGITSNAGQWDASVTLHTGIGDFTLHSVNPNAARTFVEAVENVAVDNREERYAEAPRV